MRQICELMAGDVETVKTRDGFLIKKKAGVYKKGKKKVNIMALGDVGAMTLTGLKLMGGDTVSSIGIWDIDDKVCARYEAELNQIQMPFDFEAMPSVEIVSLDELFQCDMMVFCASAGVPPVEHGKDQGDVRMIQLEKNRAIIESFARRAVQQNFRGVLAVVSDPVDPLCKSGEIITGGSCLIQGYGLGVMNTRAAYFAKEDMRMSGYVRDGRAFGPHGEDLVIANSIEDYNDKISRELTDLTVGANLKIREIGFKPYIAPAISSGAISILETLRGNWHYGSVYLGDREGKGAFLGVKNRIREDGIEIEDMPLPDKLFERIAKAYKHLSEIV